MKTHRRLTPTGTRTARSEISNADLDSLDQQGGRSKKKKVDALKWSQLSTRSHTKSAGGAVGVRATIEENLRKT